MHYTRFAGLTVPDEGESIRADGSSFLVDNPEITDYFLKLGALTHHHDGAQALATPERPLDATAVASGGQLPSDQPYSLTYTLIDERGGETLAAAARTVATGAGITAPAAPTAAPDYTQGIMPAGVYIYAKTLVDGQGGETTIGPSVRVTVAAGHASGAVALSGLASEVDAGTAAAWRLWRSYNGAEWHLVLQGVVDTYLDSGYDPPDNPARPPLANTTAGAWSITVTLPTAVQEPALASAAAINVYLSTTDEFPNPSWYGSFPVASGGHSFTIGQATVGVGAPPHEPTAIGGPAQIDPDTELRFGLRSPVAASGELPAGACGDARFTTGTSELWAVLASGGAVGPSGWTKVGGGGGGGAVPSVPEWTDLPAAAAGTLYFVEDPSVLAIAPPGGASTPADWWNVLAPFSPILGLIQPDRDISFGWRSIRASGALTVPARFGDAIVTSDSHELYAVLNPDGASSIEDWTLIGGSSGGGGGSGGGELAYASGGGVLIGASMDTLLTLPAVASGATGPAVVEFHCPAVTTDDTGAYARVEIVDDLGTLVGAHLTPVNNVAAGWYSGNFNMSVRVANPAGRTYTVRAIRSGTGFVRFMIWDGSEWTNTPVASPMWASVR